MPTSTETDLRDAFTLFDTDGDGQVDKQGLGLILRALGHLVSEADIANQAVQHDPQSTNRFDLDVVQKIISSLPSPPTKDQIETQLLDAFGVFDREGNGQIPTAELKHILTSLGERLNEQEAEEFLKEADPDKTGIVHYERLVKKLVQNFS